MTPYIVEELTPHDLADVSRQIREFEPAYDKVTTARKALGGRADEVIARAALEAKRAAENDFLGSPHTRSAAQALAKLLALPKADAGPAWRTGLTGVQPLIEQVFDMAKGDETLMRLVGDHFPRAKLPRLDADLVSRAKTAAGNLEKARLKAASAAGTDQPSEPRTQPVAVPPASIESQLLAARLELENTQYLRDQLGLILGRRPEMRRLVTSLVMHAGQFKTPQDVEGFLPVSVSKPTAKRVASVVLGAQRRTAPPVILFSSTLPAARQPARRILTQTGAAAQVLKTA